MRKALEGLEYTLVKRCGRFYVQDFAEYDVEEIIERLKKVFGIHSMSVAIETQNDMQSIFEVAKLVCKKEGSATVSAVSSTGAIASVSINVSRS